VAALGEEAVSVCREAAGCGAWAVVAREGRRGGRSGRGEWARDSLLFRALCSQDTLNSFCSSCSARELLRASQSREVEPSWSPRRPPSCAPRLISTSSLNPASSTACSSTLDQGTTASPTDTRTTRRNPCAPPRASPARHPPGPSRPAPSAQRARSSTSRSHTTRSSSSTRVGPRAHHAGSLARRHPRPQGQGAPLSPSQLPCAA